MDSEDCSDDTIKPNSYIIIQRHGYFKLHQLLDNSSVMLGKDKVDIRNIIGKPFWSIFKMVPVKNKGREFSVDVCSKAECPADEILKAVSSGADNRNITDDGKSQLLSSEDINGLRESGLTGQKILEKIIENSTTFKEKTEYSQEKYLKKKGKKYFEFIIIRQPTLRLLSDIFYSRDQTKIMGLRHDTLSQIFTFANIQHDGVYALFENGSQALVGAGILNSLSEQGLLINLSIGVNPQKQGILAMNFSNEQLSRLVSVKIKDLFNFLDGETVNKGPTQNNNNNDNLKVKEEISEVKGDDSITISESESSVNNVVTSLFKCDSSEATTENASLISPKPEKNAYKRKLSNDEIHSSKKPKWAEDFERSVDAFKNKRLNGIIIVAKEYPLNIITKLLPYLKPSCQLVIYSVFREPLVQLYLELKKRRDVIGLHLKENWLRNYQVLPERTHPDVNMSFTGHLLTATKVL